MARRITFVPAIDIEVGPKFERDMNHSLVVTLNLAWWESFGWVERWVLNLR
jgi:hypothetical protein